MVREAPAVARSESQAAQGNLAQWWEGVMRRQSAEAPVLHYIDQLGELRTHTYREVNAWAHCLAAYVLGKGFTPGAPVLILAQGGPSYLLFDLGCHLAGGINVTLSAGIRASVLQEALARWLPSFLLLDSLALYRRLRSGGWYPPSDGSLEIICRCLPGEEPDETDEVTLFDQTMAHGKEWWRWAPERIAHARSYAGANDTATHLQHSHDSGASLRATHSSAFGGPRPASDGYRSERSFTYRHKDLIVTLPLEVVRNQQAGPWLVYFQPEDITQRQAALYAPLQAGIVPVWVPHWHQFWTAHRLIKPGGWQVPPAVVRRIEQLLRAPHRVSAKRSMRLAQAAARWAQAQDLLEARHAVPGHLRWRRAWDQRQIWAPLRRTQLHPVRALLTHTDGLPPATAQFFQALGLELHDINRV